LSRTHTTSTLGQLSYVFPLTSTDHRKIKAHDVEAPAASESDLTTW
jgi:hypothetical protein